ncbi:MAG: hypothetical protein LBV04_06045 [Deferribacteraceae bacterium]|jgi:hypothetical protein|nr:hypothetical protein [Deferribacteraceae bacterium]
MKKLLGLTAIMVLAFSVAAFAWGGWGHNGGGHGYGHGYNEHGGYYNGNGGFGGGAAPSPTVTSEDSARKIVEDYFSSSNLKGYRVTAVDSYDSGNGFDVYTVSATDASGNNMRFQVSPFGQVFGPIFN